MQKRKQFSPWAGGMAVMALLVAVCIGAPAIGMDAAPKTAVVDRIVIDEMARFGDLELPPVSFFHAKHTKAMTEAGKDCTVCHKEKDGKLLLLFQRPDNAAGAGLKEIYHQGCIGCHTTQAEAGKPAGPREGQCRDCHQVAPGQTPRPLDAGFDNTLHYRHWASKQIVFQGDKDNCGVCHHVYKPELKKTVYEKGKEGSCRFCHLDKPVQDKDAKVEIRDLQDAVHQNCVNCHLSLKKSGAEAFGPVDCGGCHSPEGRIEVKAHDVKVLKDLGGELPALPMQRPETAMILPPLPEKAQPGDKIAAMPPVAFDHKAHEKANDSCRTCHHKGMQACSTCHTPAGDEKGGFVTLDVAMHDAKSRQSCVGCHRAEQQARDCAGCHRGQTQAARTPDASCNTCHVKLPEGMDLVQASRLDEPGRQGLAARLIEAARAMAPAYAPEDIPETVTIGGLSKDYKPAAFPHRKIVQKLLEPLGKDKLAAAFHAQKGLVCQGCHHNSPASMTPPTCASCHGKPFAAATPDRPGLKAAYHGQCMSCHKAMGITELAKGEQKLSATSCVVCHDEKK
ncbi:MAG: sulfate respiration complex hexadecaheme cytochrome HmcA [Desulfovibrionaceae bacterium]